MCVCVCGGGGKGASIPNIFYTFNAIFFPAAPKSELDATAWAFYTITYYVDSTRRAAFLAGVISVASSFFYRPIFFAYAFTPHFFLTPLIFP